MEKSTESYIIVQYILPAEICLGNYGRLGSRAGGMSVQISDRWEMIASFHYAV